MAVPSALAAVPEGRLSGEEMRKCNQRCTYTSGSSESTFRDAAEEEEEPLIILPQVKRKTKRSKELDVSPGHFACIVRGAIFTL